jgi:hypothetical protein
MPPHRIKLAHTIDFKMKTVEEYLSSAETREGFCKGRDFSRSTLQYWVHQFDAIQMAVKNKRRSKKLTVGGSGRVSPSVSIEDELCGWIKDVRREERPVCMD